MPDGITTIVVNCLKFEITPKIKKITPALNGVFFDF